MKKIRDKIRDKAETFVGEVLIGEHQYGYNQLLVGRDGEVYTHVRLSENEWEQYKDGTPVYSLINYGTGNIQCNCDWCTDGDEYEIQPGDRDYMMEKIQDSIDKIPDGYFDDEDDE